MLAVLLRNIEKFIFGKDMLGIFIPNFAGPLVVAWTFGAATLGGGAAAGFLCGSTGGAWLLSRLVRLLIAIGNGLSCLVSCGLLGFGSVSGCLRGV